MYKLHMISSGDKWTTGHLKHRVNDLFLPLTSPQRYFLPHMRSALQRRNDILHLVFACRLEGDEYQTWKEATLRVTSAPCQCAKGLRIDRPVMTSSHPSLRCSTQISDEGAVCVYRIIDSRMQTALNIGRRRAKFQWQTFRAAFDMVR